MENFLDNKSSNRMKNILVNEKCPNKISLKNRKIKMDNISSKASKEYIDILFSKMACSDQ